MVWVQQFVPDAVQHQCPGSIVEPHVVAAQRNFGNDVFAAVVEKDGYQQP